MPSSTSSTTRSSACLPNRSERFIRGLAGTVVLTGLGLGWLVSPWFYLITAFAGLNLLQSSITGFCPPEILLNTFSEK